MVGQLMGISHIDSHPRLWMTVGGVVSKKSNRITWRSEWTPCLEKFSEKSFWSFSSWNWTWRGVGSKEDSPRMKRVLRRSGFVLGCHVQIMRVRERERERNKQKSTITKSTPKKEKKMYVCMKCAWACYVQRKYIMGSTQSNPNNTQVSTIMHETLWKCKCIAMHEHITSYK